MSRLIEQMLIRDESFRPTPYYCTEDYPTVGIGRKIGNKGSKLPNICVTLEDELILLRKEIASIETKLSNYRPALYAKLNEARRAVLISMVYQLGWSGVMKFKLMWAALDALDYVTASNQMLDSLWAKQTPNRAKRLAEQMKTGNVHAYYK
jgi:lysozyme